MMKNRKEIERWEAATEEELLSLAETSDIEVPGELSGKLDTLIKRLDAEEKRDLKAHKVRRIRTLSLSTFGLAAASIAAVLLLKIEHAQPKDTFSSPEEAYAMLQSTFSHIAAKSGAATMALEGSMQHIEGTITEIYR